MPPLICPRCKKTNPETASFCHFDGEPLRPVPAADAEKRTPEAPTTPIPGNARERFPPPPWPAACSWFVRCRGCESGPFSVNEIMVMAATGSIGPEDRVRKGQGAWVPAKQLDFLAVYLAKSPAQTSPASAAEPQRAL